MCVTQIRTLKMIEAKFNDEKRREYEIHTMNIECVCACNESVVNHMAMEYNFVLRPLTDTMTQY